MGGLGNLYFASLRADKSITALDFTDYGTLGISNANFPLEIVKEGPFWMGFSADHRARDLIRYRFNSPCDADQEIANGLEVRKAFSSSGTKTIVVETSLGNEVRKGAATVEINSSQAPPADFSYIASCVSTPVKYVFSENTDDLVSINWDFGDGTSGTGSSVEHSYASAGSYNVTAQIESQNGCTNQIKKEVFVYPEFNAGFSISNQISCTNAALIFQNEIDEDLQVVVSHEWSIDGVQVSNDVDLTYMFDEAGTYNVQLVSSLNECSSTYSEMVEVLEGPVASFIVSDACVGTSFNFNNTSSGDISGYIWNFGDGTSSTLESPVYTYDSPGDYTVRLTAFNDAGCETTIEQLVTVYSQPIPEFSTGLACELNPVQFTDQSTVSDANIESWFWDFGDGNTSQNQNPSAQFNSDGIYTVNLTVTSTFGCESTITRNIEVLPSPEVSFSYSDVCLGEEVQFTDESIPPPGESITEWAWDLGGEFSSDRNPVKSFDFPVEYDVSLTVQASN
jgi:PKD repeat protein